MRLYFFDTCALQHRYVGGAYSARIRHIVSDSRCQCHIADWTVLEMASALGRHCRLTGLSCKTYDQLGKRFFEDIACGRLVVRSTTVRDVTRARDLIRFAGVLRRRNLKSADALIAAACLDFAYEKAARVIFCTSDWTLYSILRDINHYSAALRLRLIGTPRNGTVGRG